MSVNTKCFFTINQYIVFFPIRFSSQNIWNQNLGTFVGLFFISKWWPIISRNIAPASNPTTIIPSKQIIYINIFIISNYFCWFCKKILITIKPIVVYSKTIDSIFFCNSSLPFNRFFIRNSYYLMVLGVDCDLHILVLLFLQRTNPWNPFPKTNHSLV